MLYTSKVTKESKKVFDSLVGLEDQKESLLRILTLLLDESKISKWKKKFHADGFPLLDQTMEMTPLVILAGEVGCGKTAIAHSVGAPLQEKLGKKVITLETPTNIRGSGLVGEISNKITAAFQDAKSRLKKNEVGLLIIDEADDLATSREQNQAHHEDRAGLNVLIKQIDLLMREKVNIVAIMITNRISVIDPAIYRRATAVIEFERPQSDEKLREVFSFIFGGIDISESELIQLVQDAKSKEVSYSYSDLIQKIAKQAIYNSIENDEAFGVEMYRKIMKQTKPSPLIINNKNLFS